MGLIIELADEKCRSRIIYINSKEGLFFLICWDLFVFRDVKRKFDNYPL